MIVSFLECLSFILEAGMEIFRDSSESPFVLELEEKGGYRILEMLQFHPDTIVYESVSNLIEEYFYYEEVKVSD